MHIRRLTRINVRRLASAIVGAVVAVIVVPGALLGHVFSAAAATNRASHPQTLFVDALFTQSRSGGPEANHVGHQQIVSGVLRNAAGREVGRFAFTCTWIRSLPAGDAVEHCSGHGQTADGRLDFMGQTLAGDSTHMFAATGGTGRYRGARGTLVERGIGDTEALIDATLTARHGSTLTVATIPRPSANLAFLARADRLCTYASAQLAALPPFPYPSFDPLHPDPALLPNVGEYFTGPGDPRPTFRGLINALAALGMPPASPTAWTRVLDARRGALEVIAEQDSAALAANVRAFVQSVHDSSDAFRRIAISATVFGATECIL